MRGRGRKRMGHIYFEIQFETTGDGGIRIERSSDPAIRQFSTAIHAAILHAAISPSSIVSIRPLIQHLRPSIHAAISSVMHPCSNQSIVHCINPSEDGRGWNQYLLGNPIRVYLGYSNPAIQRYGDSAHPSMQRSSLQQSVHCPSKWNQAMSIVSIRPSITQIHPSIHRSIHACIYPCSDQSVVHCIDPSIRGWEGMGAISTNPIRVYPEYSNPAI